MEALAAIAMVSGDVSVAFAAASELLAIIEAQLAFFASSASSGASSEEMRNRDCVLESTAGRAVELAPFLRSARALTVLRAVREISCQPSWSWVELCYSMGFEASPLDPAAKRPPPPAAAEAASMWRSLHGDAPPPGAPFPGQPGWKLPSSSKEAWVPAPACNNPCCPRVRGGVGEAMEASSGHGANAIKALLEKLAGDGMRAESRRFEVDAAELKKCGGCGTVVYCGTECQKISWAARAETCAPGEEPFPPSLSTPAAVHKHLCKLVRRAREQGRL